MVLCSLCQIVGTYQRNWSFTTDDLHAGNPFNNESGYREMDPLQYIPDFTLSSFFVFSPSLSAQEAIQLDGEILFALLKRVSPVAHRHLKKHKIDPILYMTEWFMCAFSRTLPWASVLRVWDMFFCEGETLTPCVLCPLLTAHPSTEVICTLLLVTFTCRVQ